MKNFIRIFIITIVIQQANAQDNTELKSLIQKSFTYYPKIKELEKGNELSDLKTDIARGGYLPSIAGNASYNYVNPVGQASIPVGPNETRTLQFQPNNNYNANISVNQVIFDFGRTQAQIEKAKSDLQLNQYNIESARLQLASQVANIYYGLIYLKQSIAVQDSVISFYEQNKTMVEGRIRQGDALQIDLSNIENSIEQERSRKVEFQRLYQRQLAVMEYTSGIKTEPTSSAFDFNSKSVSSEVAEQQNPEVLAAAQRILSAQTDVRLAQHNQLPSLNFVASAGFRNGYQPDINEIRFNYLAGVTLSVPIFQGRRLRQNVLLAQKLVETNEFSKLNVNTSLKKDLDFSMADINAYEQQIKLSETQITTANEALRLNRVRYVRGVSTYLDLVYASTNLQRALLNKVQFEYQRCLSYVEQARLQGVKFWE
jgi:outer membrane protein